MTLKKKRINDNKITNKIDHFNQNKNQIWQIVGEEKPKNFEVFNFSLY